MKRKWVGPADFIEGSIPFEFTDHDIPVGAAIIAYRVEGNKIVCLDCAHDEGESLSEDDIAEMHGFVQCQECGLVLQDALVNPDEFP